MIVECPSCHTRYRTEMAGVVDETTFFECSQPDCGHVFQFAPPLVQTDRLPEQDPEQNPEQDPEQDITPEVPPSSEAPAAGPAFEAPADGPAFTSSEDFSSSDTLSMQLAAADLPAEQDWSDSLSPDLNPEREAATADATDSASPGHAAPAQCPPVAPRAWETPPAAVAPSSDAVPVDEGQVEQPPRPVSDTHQTVFSFRFPLALLGLLVAGYAGLTSVAASHVEQTAAVFSHLPVLGPLLDAQRPSARHIALTKIRGGFWHTKDGHRVFAIAGRAVNQAAAPVQRIHIEGALLSDSGTVLEQRRIFCGTETAPEVLESLTRRQVHILQGLMPPKQFWVAAGEGVDFLIAFTDPTDRVVEFSSRVVAAQFGRPS